jgi:hypothetical protein
MRIDLAVEHLGKMHVATNIDTPFIEADAREFVADLLSDSDALVICGPNGSGAAKLVPNWWNGATTTVIGLWVWSESHGEGLRIIRQLIAWAKSKGAGSILVPADPKLTKYYKRCGLSPHEIIFRGAL